MLCVPVELKGNFVQLILFLWGVKLRSAMLAFKGTSFPLSGFDGSEVSCVNFMVFYA